MTDKPTIKVVLTNPGSKPFNTIAALRQIIPQLSYEAADRMTRSVPHTVTIANDRASANAIKGKLEAAGATVELRGLSKGTPLVFKKVAWIFAFLIIVAVAWTLYTRIENQMRPASPDTGRTAFGIVTSPGAAEVARSGGLFRSAQPLGNFLRFMEPGERFTPWSQGQGGFLIPKTAPAVGNNKSKTMSLMLI